MTLIWSTGLRVLYDGITTHTFKGLVSVAIFDLTKAISAVFKVLLLGKPFQETVRPTLSLLNIYCALSLSKTQFTLVSCPS
jgi:hypothetical protein